MRKQGKLILILGPSGSGKGTIINYLKNKYKDFVFPASYTTREKRPNEIEGDAYHYISQSEFEEEIKQNKLLEWAIVHEDNSYGTDKNEIESALEKGQTIVREVDIQGVRSIWKILGKENVYTIFIAAQSWQDLERRIKNRANIDDNELEKRERSYHKEMEFADECDYIAPNVYGEIDKAFVDIDNILKEIRV